MEMSTQTDTCIFRDLNYQILEDIDLQTRQHVCSFSKIMRQLIGAESFYDFYIADFPVNG